MTWEPWSSVKRRSEGFELAKPGVIILDDVHKPVYRAAAQEVLEEMGLSGSACDWTRDPDSILLVGLTLMVFAIIAAPWHAATQ